jgi:hypothetical protein
LSGLSLSDQIAIASGAVSFTISVIALVVALFAIQKGDRNSSAATLVTLNEAFRQAWQRFLSAKDDTTRQYEFSELMNLLEICSAIYLEDSLSGVSRELAEEYLGNTLSLLEGNQDARAQIESMRHSPTTFKYIRRFLLCMGRAGHPHKIAVAFSTA